MAIENFLSVIASGHLYNYLYHFTDKSNIPSIAKFGILSKHQLSTKGIEVNVPGGNEWSRNADELKKLGNFVNLCFTTSHPMCYVAHMEGNIPNPRYLIIDPKILLLDGVKITLDVANKATTKLLDVANGLEGLDKEVLYTRTDWNDPDIQTRLQVAEKCEILVPKTVPVKYILRY